VNVGGELVLRRFFVIFNEEEARDRGRKKEIYPLKKGIFLSGRRGGKKRGGSEKPSEKKRGE